MLTQNNEEDVDQGGTMTSTATKEKVVAPKEDAGGDFISYIKETFSEEGLMLAIRPISQHCFRINLYRRTANGLVPDINIVKSMFVELIVSKDGVSHIIRPNTRVKAE